MSIDYERHAVEFSSITRDPRNRLPTTPWGTRSSLPDRNPNVKPGSQPQTIPRPSRPANRLTATRPSLPDQITEINPAHITSHHTKQPRNQSRPLDAASHPQAAHLTLPINNPQVKPGPKRLHTADTPYPWPTQRRKAKPHPHKTTQKPGQPRKDSVYITHLSRKNKIVLMRADVERRTCGSALVAWWAPPPVGLLAP